MTTEHPVPLPRPAADQMPEDHWWLEQDDHGVTACSGRGPVAHAEVSEDGGRVQLTFWVDERLPRDLRTRLARTVFGHPALQHERPVSAALPHRETDVLVELRSHVADATTHVAGATCLL